MNPYLIGYDAGWSWYFGDGEMPENPYDFSDSHKEWEEGEHDGNSDAESFNYS